MKALREYNPTLLQKSLVESNDHGDFNIQIKSRIGIITGPVVVGMVRLSRTLYDLWGDTSTFHVASNGAAGRKDTGQS